MYRSVPCRFAAEKCVPRLRSMISDIDAIYTPVRVGLKQPRWGWVDPIQAVARAREGFPTVSLGLRLVSPAQLAGPGQLAMSLQSL